MREFDPNMRKTTSLILLLALSTLAYGLQRNTGKPAGNSPFNEQRAGADLQTIVGFGPRPAGSDAIVKSRTISSLSWKRPD